MWVMNLEAVRVVMISVGAVVVGIVGVRVNNTVWRGWVGDGGQ